MAKKILVIDDDPHLTMMVTSRLRANGYDVVTAADGEEGVGKVKKEFPDLVLLDILMPKMDGYGVLSELKSEPRTKNIPVIMFTAKAQGGDITDAVDGGAVDYIIKPFKPEDLLKKIRNAL